jgi:hypothetical protein
MANAHSRWQPLAVLTLMVVSGCGHDWTVLRQATPNRLEQQRSFVVEPIHFERMLVRGMPEAEFLANKGARTIESWQADKADMSRLFYESLARHAKALELSPTPSVARPGAFVIRPICTFIEPGEFNVTITTFTVRVQILDPAGALVDEVSTGGNVAPVWYQPSSGGRLRSAAKIAGENLADYVRSRTGIRG